jgi:transcriptional regulator with GAF, ATPase, and Fis domain
MDSLSERMAEFARQLQDRQDDPDATFQLAVELARSSIDGCDGAALSFVRSRSSVETVAGTDQMAIDADRLQYELGEGPCLDAIWEQQTTHSPSLGHDARWPVWGPRVVEQTEAQSILAFQLFTHEDTLGALNLYSRDRDAFDAAAREEGLAIAAHIAIAIAASQEIHHLSIGLDSRTVIGQATGILMERFDLGSARAFGVLTRLSSHSNVKLREVAAEIVANRGAGEVRRA